MRVGGPARHFATPASIEELERLAAWARGRGLPLRVLGGGSNVLVSDDGVEGLVVSLRRACGETRFEGERVVAGAGVMLPALAREAAERDLGGLEFAIGIPGAIGGALQSNAGVGDGRCIGPLVEAVSVLDVDGRRVELGREALRFDYRRSSLRGSGRIVLEATLRLQPRPRTEVEAEMRRLLEARQASQPTAEPNAGSIFRNPEGDFAGRLIEAAGCKGLEVGRARVSTKHANFIVHDGASAADVAALMAEVQRRVAERFGVVLVPEVEWWGDGEAPEAFRAQAS
jgi:UDP-N-acetylmuramate dehydrogenase